jgi:hypothetical protein
MTILGEGRQAFLEFLRNLTPQVLLLVVALSTWVRLDFSTFDASNWRATSAFFACATTLLFAVVANALQFFDSYLSAALKAVEKKMERARRRLPDTMHRRVLLWRLTKRSKWSILFHFIVTFLVMQVGVLGAAYIGIRQAIQLLR